MWDRGVKVLSFTHNCCHIAQSSILLPGLPSLFCQVLHWITLFHALWPTLMLQGNGFHVTSLNFHLHSLWVNEPWQHLNSSLPDVACERFDTYHSSYSMEGGNLPTSLLLKTYFKMTQTFLICVFLHSLLSGGAFGILVSSAFCSSASPSLNFHDAPDIYKTTLQTNHLLAWCI